SEPNSNQTALVQVLISTTNEKAQRGQFNPNSASKAFSRSVSRRLQDIFPSFFEQRLWAKQARAVVCSSPTFRDNREQIAYRSSAGLFPVHIRSQAKSGKNQASKLRR